MKNNRFKELLSIQVAKNPSRVILVGIILINFLFMCLAAFIISVLCPESIANRGFLSSLFYTISMIMDAGCMSYVVNDLGETSGFLVLVCVVIVLVGMIFFTGGIIGYVSNMIASFIDNSNAGKRPLNISDHTIILNWNSRASEIVNDLLYCERDELVVVMVHEDKETILSEIENRLSETIITENMRIRKECKDKNIFRRLLYYRRHQFKNNVTVIVRQGDTFSNKQLMDISVDKAKAIIILNRDNYDKKILADDSLSKKGNSLTIKTLVLVAEITAAEASADNQKIIVEIEDEWTGRLVDKIIANKEKLGKCNIVPMPVSRVLGQLLSQFSLMPELNIIYSELFSNKGAEFYAVLDDPSRRQDEDLYGYLHTHYHAVPLTLMNTKIGRHFYFMTDLESDLHKETAPIEVNLDAELNPDWWQPRSNIIILGHNSKVESLMEGFEAYRDEWNNLARNKRDILNICVVDNTEGLSQIDYYKEYPYVNKVVEADIYDADDIYAEINAFIDQVDGNVVILILSDDTVAVEDFDAKALTYLIYVQDIIRSRIARKAKNHVDVVVEILNPKNYDVVRSYSINNVVISNRYISKMITQIGEKEALFEFYKDILTYDEGGGLDFTSMEIYIKRVGDYFRKIPGKCTAAELIRYVYIKNKEHDEKNLAIMLGYISEDGTMQIFSGNQKKIYLELKENDKLIMFSNH